MRSKYRKLFIIGNGFDRWQGLPTSYDKFKEYYRKNIGSISKALNIETSTDHDGNIITPVELVFGDINSPKSLHEEFFWNFENNLALLDDQKLIKHFNKSRRGLYSLQETVVKAQRILQKAFGDWIAAIKISECESGYDFGNDSYFINFNYTDTLEKRFCVNKKNDYHIHGEATEPEELIFGHSTHPEMAFSELMEQKFISTLSGEKSKRLQGLYLIEDVLYNTDKHVQDNIDDLCEFMTLDGVHIEDFTDVYVLGHSFAEVDYDYFEFLIKATQAGCNFNELSFLCKVRNIGLENIDEDSLLEFIQLNLVYAFNHRRRALGIGNMRFPEIERIERFLFGQTGVYLNGDGAVHRLEELDAKAAEAVQKRYTMEQAARTKEVIEELCMLKGINELPADCCSVLKAAGHIDRHDKRNKDAVWHISYFSDQDKKRIEEVMKKAGGRNYTLYHGIDDCLAEFRKNEIVFKERGC